MFDTIMCSHSIWGKVPYNFMYVSNIDWSKVIFCNSIDAMCLQSICH